MKVRVSSRPEKFRRAGMEFTREPQIIEVNKKTLDILKAEPLLVVEGPLKEEKADQSKEESDPEKKETGK